MDSELIELLKAGTPEGLAELRHRFGPLIRYVVEGILQDRRDAEECVNDVYMRLWSAAGTLDPGRPLKPFVIAVARNAAVSRLRARAPEEGELTEGIPGGSTPEDELLRRERLEELKSALGRLSPSDRQLIYRKYYYRQSIPQMAAELGLTERSVEGRLYRLRRRLRDLLGGDEGGR